MNYELYMGEALACSSLPTPAQVAPVRPRGARYWARSSPYRTASPSMTATGSA